MTRTNILSKAIKIRSVLKSCETKDQVITTAHWIARLIVKGQLTDPEQLYSQGILNAIKTMDKVENK